MKVENLLKDEKCAELLPDSEEIAKN